MSGRKNNYENHDPWDCENKPVLGWDRTCVHVYHDFQLFPALIDCFCLLGLFTLALGINAF